MTHPTVRFADFTAWNGKRSRCGAAESASPSQRQRGTGTSSPEFIAVSADGRRAWATLQENNALAIIDVVGVIIASSRSSR
ncbi:MAG: hypothetical protein IPK33_22685 [Gemmatimonadetes bacterium]|nr:hypothetical protein [Gemmatimonadota bacterium]